MAIKALLIGYDVNEFPNRETGELVRYARFWLASDERPRGWQGIGMIPRKIRTNWEDRYKWMKKADGLILEPVNVEMEVNLSGYRELVDIQKSVE